MEIVLAFVIGGLYAAGLFMMLRPSAVKLIIGISLLGHAANLLIFTIAGLTRGKPPLITGGLTTAAAVRRSDAAGLDLDRHRHRLCRSSLRSGADPTGDSNRWHRRSGSDEGDRLVNILLVLPMLIPFSAATLSLLAWRSRRAQRVLGVLGTALLLVSVLMLLRSVSSGGIQVASNRRLAGAFRHHPRRRPFQRHHGGACRTHRLVGGGLFDRRPWIERASDFGYYPLLHVLLMGVCGAFLTGDLFNLYVWFEVMLMASFVLMALGGERAQMEGAIKYVTINLISSALFLAAVGMLYGVIGTLNMADLAQKLRRCSAAGSADGGRHALSGRVRHQGRGVPAFFLAAGLVPYAAGCGIGDLRRPAHQSRRLRADPRFHAVVRSGHGLHAYDHSGACPG